MKPMIINSLREISKQLVQKSESSILAEQVFSTSLCNCIVRRKGQATQLAAKFNAKILIIKQW